MNKLDIIVTHYKEPNHIVSRFLKSLSEQTFNDLKVTIVDDGMECPDLDFINNSFQLYPFKIDHLKKEHQTVSAARNYGFNNTCADYVMFCDCDDMFDSNNTNGLKNAIDKILAGDIKVYRSIISAESWKNNAIDILSCLYKKDNNDELMLVKNNSINASTIHGKIYSREFINKYGIKFIDELWMNEDGAFNSMAASIAKMKNGLFDDNNSFYIWKYNENSVTRKNISYPISGYDQYIKSTTYIYKKLFDFNLIPENFNVNLMQFIFQSYYWLYLYSDKFKEHENFEKMLNKDYEEFRNFIIEFEKYVDYNLIFNSQMINYIDAYMKRLPLEYKINKKDFKNWLNDIVKPTLKT